MVQLKLDAAALAVLFPEGSEARVELQSAVMAEFTRKHVKDTWMGPEIARQIDAGRNEAQRVIHKLKAEVTADALFRAGVTGGGGYAYSLSKDAREGLTNVAKAIVQDTLRDAIKQAVEEAATKLSGGLAHDLRAKVFSKTDAVIEETVRAQVEAVFRGLKGGA